MKVAILIDSQRVYNIVNNRYELPKTIPYDHIISLGALNYKELSEEEGTPVVYIENGRYAGWDVYKYRSAPCVSLNINKYYEEAILN